MSPNELKKLVKKKFPTMRAFVQQAGLDEYEMQKALSSFYKDHQKYKEFRDKAAALCRQIVPKAEGIVTLEKIEALREALENTVGGVPMLCDKKGFSRSLVYTILKGHYHDGASIRCSPAVKEIFDHFKIEL